jgi:hypothetical protein
VASTSILGLGCLSLGRQFCAVALTAHVSWHGSTLWHDMTWHVTCVRLNMPCHVLARFLRALFDAMVCMLNGDIRQSRVVHYCNGCCGNARDAAAKIADQMITGFVSELNCNQPSTIKWHTFEPTICAQGGFGVVHNLATQVCLEAFEAPADSDEDDGDGDDDFYKTASRKLRSSRNDLLGGTFVLDRIVALWATESPDKLNATLQHADEAGKSMLDATWPGGCVNACEKEQFLRASSCAETYFPLSTICYHFEAGGGTGRARTCDVTT